MATLRVVNFSRQLGFYYKVIVNGDAFEIVQARRKKGSN
jgi:hypothetical protein